MSCGKLGLPLPGPGVVGHGKDFVRVVVGVLRIAGEMELLSGARHCGVEPAEVVGRGSRSRPCAVDEDVRPFAALGLVAGDGVAVADVKRVDERVFGERVLPVLRAAPEPRKAVLEVGHEGAKEQRHVGQVVGLELVEKDHAGDLEALARIAAKPERDALELKVEVHEAPALPCGAGLHAEGDAAPGARSRAEHLAEVAVADEFAVHVRVEDYHELVSRGELLDARKLQPPEGAVELLGAHVRLRDHDGVACDAPSHDLPAEARHVARIDPLYVGNVRRKPWKSVRLVFESRSERSRERENSRVLLLADDVGERVLRGLQAEFLLEVHGRERGRDGHADGRELRGVAHEQDVPAVRAGGVLEKVQEVGEKAARAELQERILRLAVGDHRGLVDDVDRVEFVRV